MVLIKALKIYSGTYKYCARNNLSDNTFLYDSNYRVYLVDENFDLKYVGILSSKAELDYTSISFHPNLREAAILLSNKSLAVSDFNGTLLWERTGNFACVLFSKDGKFIWGAEKRDHKHLKLWVLNSQNGAVQYFYDMNDDLYDSALKMSDIPNSNNVTLELAAGQDGISMYELSLNDGKLRVKEMFPHTCYITPAWKPDGLKMFTLENDSRTFAHFSYPDIELLSQQSEMDYSNEELSPGYSNLYLKNNFLITQNVNYRFFLLNPITMERIDEIAFQGYEPIPTKEVFKTLEEDNSLYSKIIYFDRIGNLLVAKTGDESNIQDVLMIDENSIIQKINR